MREQKIKSIPAYIVFVLCVVQIVYLTVFSALNRNEMTGMLCLFILILAIEFFALIVCSFITFSRITDNVVKGILSIKNTDGRTVPVGISYVDSAMQEVIDFYNAEKAKSKKKIELIMTCIETPIASELLKNGLPIVLDITEADACAYYNLNNGTGKLELMESYGFGKGLYKSMDISIGEGLEGLCAKRGETSMLSEDVDMMDMRYSASDSYGKEFFNKVLAVPVMGAEGCLGVMTLAYKKEIHENNIADAEELAKFFAPVHYGNLRYEIYRRQISELELQNNLIQDINHELTEKNKEIEELKKKLEEK